MKEIINQSVNRTTRNKIEYKADWSISLRDFA